MLKSDTLDKDKYKALEFTSTQSILIPDQSPEIVDLYTAQIKAFSFHHYLHLLFAECLKNLRSLPVPYRGLSLRELFDKLVCDTIPDQTDYVKLVLFEAPMESE
jgi:E3 ubiquitin-protein ligase UBR1